MSAGPLLEGVRAQAELLGPRRDQMGALHRPLRTVRDEMLSGMDDVVW